MRVGLEKLAALYLAAGLTVCCGSTPGVGARDPRWAEPLSRPGLPNLHRIEDGLYRGAQPSPEGFRQLAAMGVKTVVDLRAEHSDVGDIEEAGIDPGTFELVEIPVQPTALGDKHVIAFLRVSTDPARRPLFFHCRHGADRTGTMAAAYRVVVQGWTRDEAIREMTDGGFGFHSIFVNLVSYIRAIDVERIRREAGLSDVQTSVTSFFDMVFRPCYRPVWLPVGVDRPGDCRRVAC